MTTHGTFKKSGIPILPHGFRGLWGNAWFADFDHGSDGNGDTPARSYKYLDTLLTDKIGRDDVVYIRPRDADSDGGDPQYYTAYTTANSIIAQGKEGITLVGTHPGSLAANGKAGHMAHRTYIGGHASAVASTPILQIRAPYATIENLAFRHTNGSTTITSGGCVKVHGGVGNSYEAFGTTFANCLFRFAEGADDMAGIYNIDSWYMDVIACYFYRCECGIAMYGSNSTCRGLNVWDSVFQGVANERACDINIMGSSSTYINVFDSKFGLDPTDTGPSGAGYYIYISSGTGVNIAGNYFADADAAGDVSIGDAIDGANYDGGGFIA